MNITLSLLTLPLILTFSFSVSAHQSAFGPELPEGVRVVGKGGGYSEMQAILINSRLALLTEVCTTNPATCSLSNQEAELLQASVAGPFDFKVNPGCFASPVQIQSPSAAMVSACEIYVNDSSAAKDFKDIATWVLTTRLMAVSGLSLVDGFALSEKVFAQFSQVENSLMLNLSEAEAVFHFLQIQVGSNKANVVSLEGRTRTLEITSLVEQSLTCEGSNLATWELAPGAVSDFGSAKGLLETDAQWSCQNGQAFKAKLHIFFAAPGFEIDRSSVRLRVVGKSASF
jgi:hypothetical protein